MYLFCPSLEPGERGQSLDHRLKAVLKPGSLPLGWARTWGMACLPLSRSPLSGHPPASYGGRGTESGQPDSFLDSHFSLPQVGEVEEQVQLSTWEGHCDSYFPSSREGKCCSWDPCQCRPGVLGWPRDCPRHSLAAPPSLGKAQNIWGRPQSSFGRQIHQAPWINRGHRQGFSDVPVSG